jgi:hypothetical protein
MSKLMWFLGLVLAIAGVLLGATSIISPGQMQIYGLTPETAAILLVGGVLSIGLAGVLGAIPNLAGFEVEQELPKSLASSKDRAPAVKTVSDHVETEKPAESLIRPAGFGRKASEMGAGLATAAAVTATAAVAETKSVAQTASGSVADTIAALEQAKSDIKSALGGVESLSAPMAAPEPAYVAPAPVEIEAAVPEIDEPAVEGELYVVEEKIIRGRPSRILSDDTVEAETDEGWMRFENLEHLNEYLDSVESGEA